MMRFVKRFITASSFLFIACNNQEKTTSRAGPETAGVPNEKVAAQVSDTIVGKTMLAKTYSSDEFGFTIHYPSAWQWQEHPGRQGSSFVLNLFPPNNKVAAKTPLRLHTDAALRYVAVMPGGLGTELPSGKTKTFSEADPLLRLSFPVSEDASRIFYLQNGEPWAYFIVPADAPSSWKNGFVFAQMGVENFRTVCFDAATGKKKSPEQCDPLTGDKVVRIGTIKIDVADTVRQILSSLRFDKAEANASSERDIRIDQPEPNSTVSSPLSLKGEARGSWFFEGSFSVVLHNAAGKLLATGIAKADGKWMTEDFVPFSASLRFDLPDTEKGTLMFKKGNPSGLKKNADSIAVPVRFLPKG